MTDHNEAEIGRRHSAYMEYNRTVRAWLVAYGVGAPVLVLTQDQVFRALVKSPLAPLVVYALTAGVGIQVVMALVNKWVNWVRYDFARSHTSQRSSAVDIADWYRRHLWISFVADVSTVGLFVVTTILGVSIIL